ncbi:MAG: nucleotidyltransferase domain-containing protein [bacterium]|nr:nucleotidyltransferase domain-containing protein [bacterium]
MAVGKFAAMGMREAVLGELREDICRVARNCGAERIALFGSVARGEDADGSDCDFMVDFAGPASLVDLAVLKDQLEELLGCAVDVVPMDGLRERHRAAVEDAIVL